MSRFEIVAYQVVMLLVALGMVILAGMAAVSFDGPMGYVLGAIAVAVWVGLAASVISWGMRDWKEREHRKR
jgi:hypothetical protein